MTRVRSGGDSCEGQQVANAGPQTTLDERNKSPGFNPAGPCAHCPYATASLLPHRSTLSFANLTLDLIQRTAKRGPTLVELTPHEFGLLAYLMSHAGEVCCRKDILAAVWHYRPDTRTNTLTECIKCLRKKLEAGFETKLIQTVHGKGYRLSAER